MIRMTTHHDCDDREEDNPDLGFEPKKGTVCRDLNIQSSSLPTEKGMGRSVTTIKIEIENRNDGQKDRKTTNR